MRLNLAFVTLALFAPTLAMAGTATSNMSVSATVSDSCTISAGALAFGAYDTVAGSAVDGTATLSVACTQGASSTITLGQGANADSGSTDAAPLRRLANGTDTLSYALFQDSGRSTVWGNTGGTGAGYTASSAAPTDVTVYGRIAASQSVPAASYSDTVVATITF